MNATSTDEARRIYCPACTTPMDVTGDFSQGLKCPNCETGFVPAETFPVPPEKPEPAPEVATAAAAPRPQSYYQATNSGEETMAAAKFFLVSGIRVILVAALMSLEESHWGAVYFGCSCITVSFMLGVIALLVQIRDTLRK